MSSTLSSSTADIELQHPELWTLHLGLASDKVNYVLFSLAQTDSLISGEIKLDLSFNDYLKSLENCIYDNPLLLKPFGKVRVVAESSHFMLFPTEIDDYESALDVLEASFPDAEGEFLTCALPNCGITMGFELPRGVESFLQRTFYNPPIVHSLVPLCEYYRAKQEMTSLSRMFLHLRDDAMKLCLFEKGKLVMANEFRFRTINDAAFFALHAWQSFGLDALNDEVQLAGEKTLRDQLTPILRNYINYVMPTIFPAAALKIGHDAVKAPYDLILLALCV